MYLACAPHVSNFPSGAGNLVWSTCAIWFISHAMGSHTDDSPRCKPAQHPLHQAAAGKPIITAYYLASRQLELCVQHAPACSCCVVRPFHSLPNICRHVNVVLHVLSVKSRSLQLLLITFATGCLQAGSSSKLCVLHFFHGRCPLGRFSPHAIRPAALGGCSGRPRGQCPPTRATA